MRFNPHSTVLGSHAFLSASKYHWINYSDDKLVDVWTNSQAAKRGTELHALAHELIRLGVKLPRTTATLNMYVNDGIGYRMSTEQVLFYSSHIFGTADTIAFAKNVLRIHDLKTGLIAGSIHQLEVYAALFCLEYDYKPGEITTILRIYQNDEIIEVESDVDAIAHIMSKIINFDKIIETLLRGG